LRQHRLTGHSSRTHFVLVAGMFAAGASVQLPAHALWVGLIPVLAGTAQAVLRLPLRAEILRLEARLALGRRWLRLVSFGWTTALAVLQLWLVGSMILEPSPAACRRGVPR